MTHNRTDDNQTDIVKRFREFGISVAVTSDVGSGYPDLTCGVLKNSFLVEVKDGDKEPSRQKLTPDQVKFHREWQGNIKIISTIEEADLFAYRMRKFGLLVADIRREIFE